ncbi:extracellular solute-binding protein [Sphingomonas sp. CFBP 13720]|uniref:extracellular solute-binding protein n=1 Tax=Sphingomonas sp. CFBP 13720 TaxID=2775302 RepID=UPI00177D8616|nr:extracellular solute-binding protein [Sphingomonas sp. CFBP 13720]MBD8679821.1 extracellular solute-binding protein [Sphingomonas sp. CFBP 13720]
MNATPAPPSGLTRRTVLAGPGAFAVAACARGRDPRGLRFWAMSYEGDYSPHLMPAFTRATGIPVDVQSVPWTAAHEKLLTAQAGGALPDVLMLPAGWIGEFAMIGAIAPVPAPALVDDMVPGVLPPTRYEGRGYAVPWSVAPQVQYFRRDLLAAAGFATPPLDWNGWRNMARLLKRRRPDDFVFLMLLNWPGALFTMLAQCGAALLRDDDTRGNFRSDAVRAAFAFYASLFVEGLAPRALSTEVQDPFAAFAQGFYAIWPSGPTTLLDLHRRRAEIAPDRWGTARLAGPAGPGPGFSVDATLCVSAATARPADAWALVRHLTSAENELRFQRLIGTLPARQSAWRSPQLASPILAPFAAQMREPAPIPAVPEWERIQIEVQLIAERIVRGLLTIDAGLAAIDTRVDRILAKRRALVDAGRIA